ncbi:hypothetical protein TUN199_03157 [Pyrenophora tritici-repentis]|nr:hypothetical protein Alg215_03782 [Pyrenophora tritici-repentis]KAI0589838.1 hypothetical protein Alg130_02708 [Pyrenophora tritici-repentis]KAI0613008.1 hypothetical protein TUN205_02771 [Pyrenophora tritici-repentis]KAI0624870.1 hypothetical protein TUN199_03157 [Pyrenophora tritici-repentis]
MTQTISKRVSLSNLTKATSAFVHHSRPKTPEPIRPTLQEQLDAAQPAEEPWDAFSYPKVRTDPGHGIWICGCGFENHLIHYQGSYPFKYLRASVVGSSILFGQLLCLRSETDEREPMYFYIGDVESYRHDPDGAAVELSIKRRLEASMRYFDRRHIRKDTVR